MQVPTESPECKDFSHWLMMAFPEVWEMTFHVPNGGFRNAREASRMKQEGVKAGVPDYMIAWPVKPYHGLFLEAKRRKGGRLRPEQVTWIDNLRQRGYRAETFKGWEDGRLLVLDYLGFSG